MIIKNIARTIRLQPNDNKTFSVGIGVGTKLLFLIRQDGDIRPLSQITLGHIRLGAWGGDCVRAAQAQAGTLWS